MRTALLARIIDWNQTRVKRDTTPSPEPLFLVSIGWSSVETEGQSNENITRRKSAKSRIIWVGFLIKQ